MIETERLQLRPVVESDFPQIYRLMSDPEVMKHIRPVSDDPEPVRSRMADWARYTADQPGLGVFTAEWKSDGAFAGYVVARHVDFDPATGEYEVGYTLAPEHWGKGLATEITRALSDYLFAHFQPEYVVAFTAFENLASQKVLLKAGFTDAGIRDVYGGSQEFRLHAR
jgi:RimJ/RimL family protein N-acetyltransferase